MRTTPRIGIAIVFAAALGSFVMGAFAVTRPDAGSAAPRPTTEPTEPTELPGAVSRARIFFSGHSLLDNPMPDFVELIASGLGQDMRWNQQNVVGSPIRVRTWGDGEWAGYKQGKNRSGSNMDVLAELKDPQTLGPAGERYDTLLITERHDILGTLQWEDTVGYLRHFHDRFIEANPKGRTYFYQTWLDIPKADPTPWIDYEKKALFAWECAASKVNLTLEAAGRPDRVVILPGSAALVELVERVMANEVRGLEGPTKKKLDAIFSDDVHLTPLGAYYLAAVHYASVFRRSPVGAPGAPGTDKETTRDLQTIAWRFIAKFDADPSPRARTMELCRQRISQELCPALSKLQAETQERTGLKKLVSGALRARDTHKCQSFFGNARAEGNPFVWPDPAQKTPSKK